MTEAVALPKRVLCLCGSLRRVSANRAALEAARALAPTSLRLEIYSGMGALPLFSPDAELDPLPQGVLDLHATVLHQLGLNHKKMEVIALGRTMRLVEEGGPIRQIIA